MGKVVANDKKYVYILGQNISKFRQEKFLTTASLYVLNCFKYFLIIIFRQNVSKNQELSQKI